MTRSLTQPWDPAEHLKTEADFVAYLEAAWEDGDPDLMVGVRETIDRAKNISEVSTKWARANGPFGAYIREESKKTLESYRSQPNNLREDANQEEDITRGGYADRQLFELVQNSADALAGSDGGYIWIRLTPTHLYCADNGHPIDESGVRAMLFSHLSNKRGTSEIGRFGLGFKSVLGVSDTPEFFSRAGSFRFNRGKAAALLRPIAPEIEQYPVLRIAEPVDPWPEVETDPNLREMVYWATNIVRLPLKLDAHRSVNRQVKEFPAEFLLFVEHVTRLVLQTTEQETTRIITVSHEGDLQILDDAGSKTRWMTTRRQHKLSADAKSDSRSLDDADEVPVWWAAPIDRLNDRGKFWAFFPTMTQSLLAGILNAPWKTNEDRQNLLTGVYNDELIDAAVSIIAEALPKLSALEDPARHLDALPPRQEPGEGYHSILLRNRLEETLKGREVVPDQGGTLRKSSEVSYPPRELTLNDQSTDSLRRWAAFQFRPVAWLHHSSLTTNRMAKLERLYNASSGQRFMPIPRATVKQWLESLIENTKRLAINCEALLQKLQVHTPSPSEKALSILEERIEKLPLLGSMAAIQTAALIPQQVRQSSNLGGIILTADNRWITPSPNDVHLASENEQIRSSNVVHPLLEANPETLRSLKELGIQSASPETEFKELASTMLSRHKSDWHETKWAEFWRHSNNIEPSASADIIRSHEHWRDALCVRTISGSWRSLFTTLLPGRILPLDGSRDRNVAIDTNFHEPNLPLLKLLDAHDVPSAGFPLSRGHYSRFLSGCRLRFAQQDLPRKPQLHRLDFRSATTSGPLDVLVELSEEGKALYTWHLLSLDSTFEPWTMRHDTQPMYGILDFESPAIEMLRQYGRVKTDDRIQDLSDGLSDPPQDLAVLLKLLSHSQAKLIRQAFNLYTDTDLPLDPISEDTPVPLLDVWPGLDLYVAVQPKDLQIIRCDGFRRIDGVTNGDEPRCIIRDGFVYVTRQNEEEHELRSVLLGLGLHLSDEIIELILHQLTPEDVRNAREAVRSCSTDEERLLVAVGETELRLGLPRGLLDILEDAREPMSGIQVAQAAISTYHTGALRTYRHALSHLDAPRQWAGRSRALEFVRSLGFSEEWAGDPNARREPFVEVNGPYALPNLHDYQRKVVGNVRNFIRSGGTFGERRGMISMPTGSGKTRVAVQAIVESMREDGFKGGILWVADRDELCEQAVEAWRQVWASEGTQAQRLRISRLWAGQPQPLPTSEMHVIVATIQTLFAKITNQPDSYDFLADFKLLVFDEAHRSVAPTFTSVMQDLGLTRLRRAHEPLLIGLTATPYRGHDERETARLVNRYGGNRLDSGAFASDDPEAVIEELQTMRVLAQADHEIMEGGEFSLSDDELQQSLQTPWLPRSVEERIASDSERTRRIIQAYLKFINPDWPTLVFATSVEHSQTVAALLTRSGIKARAVSASTEASTRRRVVEEFRAGEIKALVNYGIFREGFDAPKTRAIVVARPVYSPNLYFQMIGRGLRGVKNGGNDRCFILNVRDNIENFERKLAFSELNWLWA